jgi:hypothetical protein
MHCPRCQHENTAGQKFCGEGGAQLAASTSRALLREMEMSVSPSGAAP